MRGSVKQRLRRVLPRRVKPHTVLSGPIRGSRIVTSWHDYPAAIAGVTERPLLHWFAAHVKPGETWLDIGGHYGYTAVAIARLTGATGRVFTFEPVLSSAGAISETRRLNQLAQLCVVPIGLGAPDTIDPVSLPLTRGMADATILGSRAQSFENILVARFDWLWPRLAADSVVHGVKIDVQGMELAVLSGMLETLRRWQPVIALELHAGVERHEILALLASAGYGPARIIEPHQDETTALLLDNRSYAFFPR